MYNKNDLLWFYKQMINAVELIKSDAVTQINKLKGCCVTDEIALTFYNDVTTKAQILLNENLINKIQFDLINNINDKLDKMSQNKKLWSDNELTSNIEWNECRTKGLELLSSLEKNNSIDILIVQASEENELDY